MITLTYKLKSQIHLKVAYCQTQDLALYVKLFGYDSTLTECPILTFSESLEVCDETLAFGKTGAVTMKSNSSSSLAEAFGKKVGLGLHVGGGAVNLPEVA